MSESELEYFKYMEQFLNYFEEIINNHCDKNWLYLSTINDSRNLLKENIENCYKIQENTDLLHMILYRQKNIKFINYFHFHRCNEFGLEIPN